MKKIIFAIFALLSLHCSIDAQSISGKIVDKENVPIDFATIVLQTQDSIFVKTVYSDSLGCFSFDEKRTDFRLIVQHIMYQTINQEYHSPEVGTLQLESKENTLGEVVVRGERPLVRIVDGKMTYNMQQLTQNKMASSAYEAILELPGVHEQQDVLNLAGANGVSIIINGKPTTMSNEQLITLLKSMPKERIQSAEVMYSTPPQYHVRGASINLVLDSENSEIPQLQGQINGLYNQGYYANYSATSTLMYTTAKTSTDFMYSFGQTNSRNGDDIFSNHLYNGKEYYIEQYDRGQMKATKHNIRLANDWKIDEKNELNIVYTSQIQAKGDSYTSSQGTYSHADNTKKPDSPIQMHNIALNYTSGFGLSTGVDYTFYKNHTTQNYQEKMVGKEDAFDSKSKQDINKIAFYADQTNSLGKDWSLNYGTKFSYASDKSSQVYHSITGADLSASNSNSKIDEYVYDVYAGVSKDITEKLSLSTSITGEYYQHKEVDYYSVFPMLEMTYASTPSSIFQLSISSDKEYPSYWAMQKSISYMNGYAEIHGNPDLKPSRSYDAQLNYIFKNKYMFTLYGNYTADDFRQLPYQAPDRLALIYKTLNFDYSMQFGLNVVIPFKPASFLSSRLTVNGFYDKVKSNHYHDITFDNDNFVFYSDLDNTFNISSQPNIKANLSGTFITPNIQGPMSLSRMYRVNAGIKWMFDNNNAELSFKVDDMFNSWSPKTLKLDYKTQDLSMNIVPDTRRVSLSFTYKFGGYKKKEYKEVDSSRFGSK